MSYQNILGAVVQTAIAALFVVVVIAAIVLIVRALRND